MADLHELGLGGGETGSNPINPFHVFTCIRINKSTALPILTDSNVTFMPFTL